MQSGDSTIISTTIKHSLENKQKEADSIVHTDSEVANDEHPSHTDKIALPVSTKEYRDSTIAKDDSIKGSKNSFQYKSLASSGFDSKRAESRDTNSFKAVVQQDTIQYSDSIMSVPQKNTYSVENNTFEGVKPILKYDQDSIFVVVLACFFLIIYAIRTENNKIKSKFKNILSSHTDREQITGMAFFVDLCLIIQTILIISVFLFNVFFIRFPLSQSVNTVITITSFVIIIAGSIGAKILAYEILNFIFVNTKRIQNMRQKYIASIQIFGILAFLPILLFIYSESSNNILFVIVIILFILGRCISIYHVIINFLQEKINLLFLIAYLCTIEVLPYFILYEILLFVYKLDLTSILWH